MPRAALGVLRESRTWRSYTGAFSSQSYRDVVDSVVDGAAAGLPAPVSGFVSTNCAGL